MVAAEDEDYEHWPDEGASVASSGYDSTNGLRQHVYHLGDQEKSQAKAQPDPEPRPITYADNPGTQSHSISYNYASQHPHLTGYLHQLDDQQATNCGNVAQMQYPAWPAPAYYSLPPQYEAPAPVYAAPPPGNTHVYQSAAPPAKKKAKLSHPRKWQGRTKAEVEEDNMKMAMREGAYDERKVEPKGLSADQVVWCVELDGSTTLRPYATVKEFIGEWMTDPRFKNSWFFVREEEKKGGAV